MEHLPILFIATLMVAVVASAPPGLLNVNAAKVSVEKGKNNGISFSMGIALTVMFQAYVAVRIAKFLNRNPEVIDWLMKSAVVLFALLAVFFFVKGLKTKQEQRLVVETQSRNSFGKGFLLGWLNFLQIPFYSAVNTFFWAHQWMTHSVVDEIVFILAAATGTFIIMYLYVFYFNKLETRTNRFSKNSNYILGTLMVVLLIITLIRIGYR